MAQHAMSDYDPQVTSARITALEKQQRDFYNAQTQMMAEMREQHDHSQRRFEIIMKELTRIYKALTANGHG